MLDEIELKTVHNDKEGEWYRKRSKTLSEVKPVQNISKNLQSFLWISPVQKEVIHSKTGRPCIWVIESFLIKGR